MLYQSDYFDNIDCKGIAPQIILSCMLLQAGNIRAAKNLITNDQTAAITFDVSEQKLYIRGYLPLAEARYLLTLPSLVSRVNALNSENVALLNDSIGLPVANFTRLANQINVVLPPNIEYLSSGQLVLEKRLMYLLLALEKRQNLVSLYNFLRWAYISSRTYLQEYHPATGSGQIETAPYYTQGQFVSLFSVTELCMNFLFTQYRFLDEIINDSYVGSYTGVNKLKKATEWVLFQLGSNAAELIPFIEIAPIKAQLDEVYSNVVQFTPVTPATIIDVSSDVSSEVSSTVASSSPNPYGESLDDNPFAKKDDLNAFTQLPPIPPTPSVNPLNKDVPENSLPEC